MVIAIREFLAPIVDGISLDARTTMMAGMPALGSRTNVQMARKRFGGCSAVLGLWPWTMSCWVSAMTIWMSAVWCMASPWTF